MTLNFTKNQTLILEIFFRDPEKSYYLRELYRGVSDTPFVPLRLKQYSLFGAGLRLADSVRP